MALRGPVVLLAFGASLFAGCVAEVVPPAGPPNDAIELPPDLLVHDSSGLRPDLVPPTLDVAYRLLGHAGGEPNLGVTSKGVIFTSADDAVMRSADHGLTWEVVYDFGVVTEGADARFNSDPMLWVDPVTDRVFDAPMWPTLGCSDIIWSDDDGDTWTDRPMGCGIPGVDHQKVITAIHGPESEWPRSPLYPNVLYYCYNKLASTNCAISLDGGLTFVFDAVVSPNGLVGGCGGVNGHPSSAPDGTVYVPMTGCGRFHLGVTRDSGRTWAVVDTGYEVSASDLDDEVAVGTDGTLYVLFAGPDQRQYLGRSRDGGSTWDGPFLASPPGVETTFFEGLQAGDAGRVALAYLGTDREAGRPDDVPDDARWHLYFAYTETALDEAPVFVTQQVTPKHDPVQVGCVWTQGFPSGPCRNLLDFIDLTLDAEGRPYIAYTEGCVADCATKTAPKGDDSRDSQGAVAILNVGPSLLLDVGVLPSLGLADQPEP